MTTETAHDWTDRIETQTGYFDRFRAAAAAATLDDQVSEISGGAPETGDPLPLLWHWMCCITPAPSSQLGADGHPMRGIFVPPPDLPRRMWAGGRLTFHAPLRVGDTLTRTSSVAGVRETNGRSGKLLIVTLWHQYSRGAERLIDEQQDLVYRGPLAGGHETPAPGQPARDDARWQQRVQPDPVLLFRYSALTFNAHRIHYDLDYAMHTEGYAGLVVHGPLLATLLVRLAARTTRRRMTTFAFRGVRPLTGMQPFLLCGAPRAEGSTVDLWTRDAQGHVTMEAHATFGEPS